MDSNNERQISVKEIDDLPNEILASILSYFSSQTLESAIGQVCSRWKELTDDIVRQRLTRASRRFPETIIELRTQFNESDAELKALNEFERIYVGRDFFLLNRTRDNRNIAELDRCAAEFRSSLLPEDDEEDEDETSMHHPFDKTMKFIPSYHLLVVVKDNKCIFYHESVISNSKPYQEYTVEVDCLDLPDGVLQRVSFLDVYHDKLAVVLKITRHVILYQVTEVCHEKRRVILKPLRNIFFPDWIQAITLFKDKVYVLYTTWYFAMWHLDNGSGEAEILTSQRKIAANSILEQIRATDYSLMCRLNNLLFVRLSYTLEQVPLVRSRKWLILDVNEGDSVELAEIPMEEIESQMYTFFGRLHMEVTHIKASGNVLLLLMVLTADDVKLWNSMEREYLFTVKLKLEPRKEDFLDPTKFRQLIDGIPFYLPTSLTEGHIASLPPSLSISAKSTFLGISTMVNAPSGIEILTTDSRHGLYIA